MRDSLKYSVVTENAHVQEESLRWTLNEGCHLKRNCNVDNKFKVLELKAGCMQHNL